MFHSVPTVSRVSRDRPINSVMFKQAVRSLLDCARLCKVALSPAAGRLEFELRTCTQQIP